MEMINQGNNEQISRGLVQNGSGYLALTFSQSKQFKSRAAAVKWLSQRGVVVK